MMDGNSPDAGCCLAPCDAYELLALINVGFLELEELTDSYAGV